MTDAVSDDKKYIENEANYWAGKVVDNIKEREEDVSDKEALETLAVLDADHSITDRMDSDDLDSFLDEFEGAVVEQVKDNTAIQDRADKASDETIDEDKSKEDADTDDGE
ncbi:hypothetical protein LCGC14_0711000 [marine sediment metagenome]|uniref:Uncharacterized protein n=1 Tax=marine sediment metagenome TaxID=412755 RepID=A0A0F9TMI9_9ZZZZ